MTLETSRFGQIEVEGDRLIRFERGILGFPDCKDYALIETGDQSGFYWLQSIDRQEVAFVVCDPRLFLPNYQVGVKAGDLEDLGASTPNDAQVFVIVNKQDDLLTGNLQGPLIIGVSSRQGRQMVLSDKRYSTRHPLMRIPQRRVLSLTA